MLTLFVSFFLLPLLIVTDHTLFLVLSFCSPDFRTKMSIAYVKGESNAFIKCEVIIDATVEEVAAYHFLLMSRRQLRLVNKASTIIRRTLTNSHHSLDYYMVRDFGFAVTPRRWLSRQVWKKDENGNIIHAFDDIESSKLLTESERANQNYVTA